MSSEQTVARSPTIKTKREPPAPRSEHKRQAILDAATSVFLRDSYLGASMDEIAALSGVSKQTIYKHFGSKEALFIEIVGSMTTTTGNTVLVESKEPDAAGELEPFLRQYAERQLSLVLTPRMMQLRRLVVAEVGRFPQLAEVLYERGPARAIAAWSGLLQRIAEHGLVSLGASAVAAPQFPWLVMAEPLNRAMLLGDGAIPSPEELKRHAAEGVRTFLASYGR